MSYPDPKTIGEMVIAQDVIGKELDTIRKSKELNLSANEIIATAKRLIEATDRLKDLAKKIQPPRTFSTNQFDQRG